MTAQLATLLFYLKLLLTILIWKHCCCLKHELQRLQILQINPPLLVDGVPLNWRSPYCYSKATYEPSWELASLQTTMHPVTNRQNFFCYQFARLAHSLLLVVCVYAVASLDTLKTSRLAVLSWFARHFPLPFGDRNALVEQQGLAGIKRLSYSLKYGNWRLIYGRTELEKSRGLKLAAQLPCCSALAAAGFGQKVSHPAFWRTLC